MHGLSGMSFTKRSIYFYMTKLNIRGDIINRKCRLSCGIIITDESASKGEIKSLCAVLSQSFKMRPRPKPQPKPRQELQLRLHPRLQMKPRQKA
jgi:hypothetical protein